MTRLQKDRPIPSSSRISSNASRTSSFLEYVYRKRYILSILSILISIGMAIGLIFVAHYWYHMWGGQGFLKSRTIEEALDSLFFAKNDHSMGNPNNQTELYIPMRKINEYDSVFLDRDQELRRSASSTPTYNYSMPFYVCGDQAQDCEAYGQPNICCPVNFECHRTTTKITVSGIYCCHFNASSADCQATKSRPPKCMPGSFECPGFTGGGCCPSGSECLNQTTTKTTITTTFPIATQIKTIGGGCALYVGNSGDELLTTTTTLTSPVTSTITRTWTPDYSNIIEQSTTSSVSTYNPDLPSSTGPPAGGSTTATLIGVPTATTVREAELAQVGAGAGVLVRGGWRFKAFLPGWSPLSIVIWLGVVAVVFSCL